MVSGRLRSRTFRRVYTKTPGARVVIHYKRRKPGFAQCAACKENLKAVPRGRPVDFQNMPKTKKRPQRPYGGVLCSACSRKILIAKARIQ